MASRYAIFLLSLALSVKCQEKPASPSLTQEVPNQGFCYFCSTENAPPLCNSQCAIAVERICGNTDNLIQPGGLTTIEGDCEVSWFPPDKTATPQNKIDPQVRKTTCTSGFNKILNKCGRDASTPETGSFNQSYCTSSGGGGTWGWNDDGTVMKGQARYIITTKNTNQCGQRKAIQNLATNVIQWDPKWLTEQDEVIYETNPPPLAEFPQPPAVSKLCDLVLCDMFDNPYYVRKGKPGGPEFYNWFETDGYLRHQVYWAGWSDNVEATEFLNALTNRCKTPPINFKAWTDEDSHVAEFELAHADDDDQCWCIADAVFDASGGIKTERGYWCEAGIPERNQRTKIGLPTFSVLQYE
ncbi:MAG: hypothetical protein Q9226_006447 [Calogaya cf. arnoldii]